MSISLDKMAAVRAAPYDPIQTLYRTILVYGAVGVLILVIGLAEFVYFEAPGHRTGYKAHIVGILKYDPATRTTTGPDRSSFARTETFAAVVDWSSVPANITVDARWYDGFRVVVGQVGPASPAQLAAQTTIPVKVPPNLKLVLPGRYIFVVERWEGGVPVEVLGRRMILVERS